MYTQRKRYFSLNFDIKLDQKLYLVVLGNLPSSASISDLRGLLFCCQSAVRRTESEWQIGDPALVDTIPFCFSLPKLLILWYETRSSKMNVADKLMKCVNSPKLIKDTGFLTNHPCLPSSFPPMCSLVFVIKTQQVVYGACKMLEYLLEGRMNWKTVFQCFPLFELVLSFTWKERFFIGLKEFERKNWGGSLYWNKRIVLIDTEFDDWTKCGQNMPLSHKMK